MSRAFVACALLLAWSASQSVALADEPSNSQLTTRPAAIAPELREQLEEIDARAARIKDLSARFTQSKQTALLKKPLASSGRVIVKGPSVRWTVAKPHESVMVTNASDLRIYYPEQKSLEIYDLDQSLGELAASPLPRLALLLKHFDIAAVPATQPREDRAEARLIRLRLTPAGPALRKHVAQVHVALNPQLAVAASVTIVDPDGDRTTITFSEIKIDSGIEDGAFDLKVPTGTTIVRPLEKLR